MKITIELNDNTLRAAVENQVGDQLAKWTGEALEKMASEVIAKKLDRFSPEHIAERTVRDQVSKLIEGQLERVLGTGWQRTDAVKKLLNAAAVEALKGALK